MSSMLSDFCFFCNFPVLIPTEIPTVVTKIKTDHKRRNINLNPKQIPNSIIIDSKTAHPRLESLYFPKN